VVFRRFRRDEQQADWLGRGYRTSEELDSYPGEEEPEEDGGLDEDDSDQGAEPAGWDVTGSGPWDSSGGYPPGERVDLGSVLVPVRDGLDVRIVLADAATPVWIDVVAGDVLSGGSILQLQAFAAPKTRGLWDDKRQEVADEVAASGGRSEEVTGPYGTELRAMVVVGMTGGQPQLEPRRILGVDGPRWLLRGIIMGPAATRPELARPLEQLFADIVVVRGEQAAPPGEPLPIEIPEETRRALAETMDQAQQQAGPPLP
jgi:Protein of unknown function (DUF3710)